MATRNKSEKERRAGTFTNTGHPIIPGTPTRAERADQGDRAVRVRARDEETDPRLQVQSDIETRRRRRPLNEDVSHAMWAFKPSRVVIRVEVRDQIPAGGRRRFPTRHDEVIDRKPR